jgi:hypothetical protein
MRHEDEGKEAAGDFFIFLMYVLILSFETINKLKLSFECNIPGPQDAGKPSLFNIYLFLIAVLENVPPTQGNRKEPPFPH